jgi:hypothetical protein
MVTFRISLAFVTAGLLLLPAATSPADLAHRKFGQIENTKLPAGTRVDLTAAELNAWAADEARIWAPGATRNIHLELREGSATGTILIDFPKLNKAVTGEDPGWLMKNLFAGERPVTVTARFESSNRRARVDVERVEVSGVPIEGAALNFLIEEWLKPTFPDVKVNQWFNLGFRINRFAISPNLVSVYIGR